MVIKIKNKPIKFLVLGRTASGKSSIVKAVCQKLNLKQAISYTTRPKRKSEDDYSDHIFINESQFEQFQNKIAAYTEIDGHMYFVTFDTLDNSDIYVVDPKGIDSLKIKCGDRYKFIEIYIRTPIELAEKRAKSRGDKLKDFKKRYVEESKQFTDYENRHTFHYHLRNDRPFNESVDKVCEWIKRELER